MDVYDFSVDYDAIAVDDILNIHKYSMKKMTYYKTFGLVKKCFFTTMLFFRCNLSSLNSLKYVSMNNQEYKIIPEIANVNSDEPVFSSFSIKISKSSGNCNNISDPFAKLCVPDVLKT